MSTVVMIRPGCTDFDEQNRVQGCLSLPLNPRGEAEVRDMVDQLREVPFEILYTSPCEPARSTAAAIGLELGVPVKELEGLKNLDQGLWQGLCIEDLRRKHPKILKQLQDAPESICAPEGETIPSALERVRKALDKPLRRGIPLAIVAPEPLATMISAFVSGTKLDLSHAVSQDRCKQRWEVLRTANGDLEQAAEAIGHAPRPERAN